MKRPILIMAACLGWALVPAKAADAAPAGEVFGHQVLPILQEKCLTCHGEGKTKGGLDLTTLAAAMKGGEDGEVIVPGKSRESMLFQQIQDREMPPKDAVKVTYEELQTIARWIDGAAFPASVAEAASAPGEAVHARAKTLWSFHAPVRPELPAVRAEAAVVSPVDRFIVAKLEEQRRTLSAPADRATFIRRVTFDLTGLPPTPEEIAAFTQDAQPGAEERLVDRLLASPRYGERWGRHWLDVAGWAESALLTTDAVRPGYWRYRDWVIEAFNDDLPYDEFVREQLAGDEMTDWRQEDQFDKQTVAKLTATGFLRCTPDGTDSQLITQEEKRFATQQTAVEVASKALMGLTLNCTRCHDHKFDPITQQEYYQMMAIFQPAYDPEKWIPGMVNDYGAGPVRAIPLRDRAGREAFEAHMANLGQRNSELSYQKENGIPNKYRDRYVAEHLAELKSEHDQALLKQALTKEERQRTTEEKAAVYAAAKEFELSSERLKTIYPQILPEQKDNQRQQKELAAEGQKVGEVIWALWDVSTNPSPTHLLTRGEFKKPAQEVSPGVLQMLDRPDAPWQAPKASAETATTGRRLAFANWLTRPDHPLTARVMVNRIWQYHFGTGLVATPDDFGIRGAHPSHPELLDWLAREFVDSGWSIKHLQRLILNSATYRQTSGDPADGPGRTLLAGFPRHRLEAEAIRDGMLAVSGLLDDKMYGPSVVTGARPDGSFDVSPDDAGRHRRSVYLSTRRSQLPTFLTLFDAPSMDTNWPKRSDSATAPQSLALMNHPFILECADGLAGRLLARKGINEERLRLAYVLTYGRAPSGEEQALFTQYLSTGGGADDRAPWQTIAHALLSSSEFFYLD